MEAIIVANKTDAYVKLCCTHSHIENRLMEIKMNLVWTIADVKGFLSTRYGSMAGNQQLQL